MLCSPAKRAAFTSTSCRPPASCRRISSASIRVASCRAISAPPPSTRVLTAVVRRKTVDDCQSLVKAAGLKLAAVGLRPLASAHAALGCHMSNTAYFARKAVVWDATSKDIKS